MRKHLKGLKYLIVHKWFVLLEGLKIGVPIHQALLHDWTKVLPYEWLPYINFYYQEDGKRRELDKMKGEQWFRDMKKQFMKSWNNHVHTHKHHWQAWLDENSNPTKMEERYLLEMVADWVGTSIAVDGKVTVNNWYKVNKDKIKLHSESRNRVEELLKRYPEATI